jgi:Domain of unknown function (DUF1858)/Uncharacterized conserved protein (DUF2249)
MARALRPLIMPTMKVAEFLASYPELEPVLVAQAPAFARLRNPLLRRTVAGVTSLQQAAAVGGIGVRALVSALRAAAGQDGLAGDEPDSGMGAEAFAADEPAWISSHRVWRVIDADALLAAEQVPLPAAMAAAASLGPGELLRVDVAFRPVPLVEALQERGFRCWVKQVGPARFEAYFERRP